MSEKINSYQLLACSAFKICLNANDFFSYASADSVDLEDSDYHWAVPFVEKYGTDGINAIMSYIRKQCPIIERQTQAFHKAYAEIVGLHPDVQSEKDYNEL